MVGDDIGGVNHVGFTSLEQCVLQPSLRRQPTPQYRPRLSVHLKQPNGFPHHATRCMQLLNEMLPSFISLNVMRRVFGTLLLRQHLPLLRMGRYLRGILYRQSLTMTNRSLRTNSAMPTVQLNTSHMPLRNHARPSIYLR